MNVAPQGLAGDAASAMYESHLNLPNRRQGKVRDIYTVPGRPGIAPRLLIVATDRISAFDVVMPTPIPGKGRLLTDISVRWFEFIRRRGIIDHHLVSTNPDDVPGLTSEQSHQIAGRMMLCRAARVVPIECVVRGYLAGSGWVDYQQSGSVCGVKLPIGLRQCDRLPEPIFTPATKAEQGHDENISFEQACAIAGADVMHRLRDCSLAIYRAATEYAEQRGIIIADTKFEFGHVLASDSSPTDALVLVDEALTPDSSRFWPAPRYEPGRDQESFDKQYLRNHLLELVRDGRWAKQSPGPELPDSVVQGTLARYAEARDRLFA